MFALFKQLKYDFFVSTELSSDMCLCCVTDQRNVLAKESHQISLEKGVLNLTVRLPTEEKSSRVRKVCHESFINNCSLLCTSNLFLY